MKFSAAFLAFGLVAAVAAQSSTQSAASPQPTSEQQKCVTACKSDVDCAAKCLGNPAPTKDMVNATTKCMADCPQGNGTQAETAKYAACQTKCINDQFLNNSGSSGSSSSDSGSGSSSDSGSGSSNSTATQTTGSGSSDSGSSDSNSTTTSTSKTGGTSSTASDQPKTGTSSGAGSFAISGIIGVLAVVSAAVALL